MSRLATVLLAVALALPVAGCGEQASPPEVRTAPSGEEYAAADAAFAADLLVHHAETLRLVDTTLGRPLPDDLAGVVEQVRATRTAQVEQLTDLLTAWDEPVPATSRDHVNAGDHADDHGTGPADEHQADHDDPWADVAALEGDAFAAAFTDALAERMEGAEGLAEEQLDAGLHEDALAVAEALLAAQDDEAARLDG